MKSSAPGPAAACSMRSSRSAEDQARGGRPAAVEVDGPDDRLDGVGEDRRLAPAPRDVLAPPEQQGVAEVELHGHLGQHAGVDHRGTHLGEGALGHVGVGAVAVLGHDEAEHGVTEELEALVGGDAARLRAPGAVRQGLDEEAVVAEIPPEAPRQLAVVPGGAGRRVVAPTAPANRLGSPEAAGEPWRPAQRPRRRPERRGPRSSQPVPSLATT